MTPSFQVQAVLGYKNMPFSSIALAQGRAGKSPCFAPLTASMVQYAKEQEEGTRISAKSNLLDFQRLTVPIWEYNQLKSGCGLSHQDCFTPQIKLLNHRNNIVQVQFNELASQKEQEEACNLHLLFAHERSKAKRRLAKAEAVSTQLAAQLTAARQGSQAAKLRHGRQIAEERGKYEELYWILQQVDNQLLAHRQAADELQSQLAQALFQLVSSSLALTDKTEEAAAVKTQLEQLRHEFADKNNAVPQAAASGAAAAAAQATAGAMLTSKEAQGQQSSSATALPAQGVWSKAAVLHDNVPPSSLGALKLKPGLGKGQGHGASAPSSPMTGAKSPSDLVHKPTAVQKEALLGSPGASPQTHQQTSTGHVSDATESLFNDSASVMKKTAVSTAASLDLKIAEPDVSTTTSPVVRPGQAGAAGGPPKDKIAMSNAAVNQVKACEAYPARGMDPNRAPTAAEPRHAAGQDVVERQCQISSLESNMTEGLNAHPAGSGQATLAGSPTAGGSSWAALADSALPQGPLVEEAAPAPVKGKKSLRGSRKAKSEFRSAAASQEHASRTQSQTTWRSSELSVGSQVGKNEDATGSAASHVAAQIDAALTRELQWAAARGMSPSRAKKIQALLKRGDKHAEERQQQGSRWKSKHQIAHVDKAEGQQGPVAAEADTAAQWDAVMAEMSHLLQRMSAERAKQCSAAKLATPVQPEVAPEASGDRAKKTRPCRAKRLQARLQVAVAELTEKDTQHWVLKAQVSVLEGQVAFLHYSSREGLMPEGYYPDLLPLTSARLESRDQESQARIKYAAASRQIKNGDSLWRYAEFSQVVRFLAPSEAGAGVLGQGAMSVGAVEYGEVLVADGQVLPSAFKKVPYGTYGEQYRVQAELAGLKDGEGCPHIVQCYGVFDYQDPVDGKRYLWIAMQYVGGVSFGVVYQELLGMRSDPNFASKWYEFGRLLLEHVLKALDWLHAQGRAHCDLKFDNMSFCRGRTMGTVSHVTLLDMGGSIKFAGPNRARPPSMVHNWDASCPELMCADPSECMDACAHDMWGVGRMLLRVLCNIAPWSVRTGCDQQDRATLCGLHDAWAETYNVPDAVHYQGVHAYLDRLYSCLTGPGQYAVAAPLIRHLLNPDVKARATVRQALASQFFS